jgi:hypothetical protein
MLEYRVTCEKPAEGRIYTEVFYCDEYDTPRDLRLAVVAYCHESVGLGWDVLALNNDGWIIFKYAN